MSKATRGIRANYDPAESEQIGPFPEISNSKGLIAEALRNPPSGGVGSTFQKVCRRLCLQGWERDDIAALLEPHAVSHCFPAGELEKLVDRMWRDHSPLTSSPFPTPCEEERETRSQFAGVMRLADFLAKGATESDVQWRVEGLFPNEGVAIIGAPPGSGKSWMLLDLAVECARNNGRWLGHFSTAGGRVLYIDEESSEFLLRKRLHKLLAYKEIDDRELDLHLSVAKGVSLSDSSGVDWLDRLLDHLLPDLVVVDSLIRVHCADENSASEMSRVFGRVKNWVRSFGCLFLFADHQRKPSQSHSSPELLLRGSTEKVAFVDTLLSLQRKNGMLVVDHSKSRFAEPVPAFVIRITDPTPGSTSVQYVGEADVCGRSERLGAATALIERVLLGGAWVSRKQLLESAKDDGVSEKAVDGALRQLAQEGRVKKEQRQPPGRSGKEDWYADAATLFPLPPFNRQKMETGSDSEGN